MVPVEMSSMDVTTLERWMIRMNRLDNLERMVGYVKESVLNQDLNEFIIALQNVYEAREHLEAAS